MSPGPIEAFLARRRPFMLALRAVIHVAFWSLLAVWILHPHSPSKLYRVLCIAGLLLCGLAAVLPSIRRRIAPPLRRILRVMDIALVNLLLLIVLGEAAARLLSVFYDSPLLSPVDASAAARVKHHRGRPQGMHNGWTLNRLGFFDREFSLDKPEGTLRIAALADSFGPGVVPYEENFLTLLEERLDRARPAEVLNFGVAGAGPPEYLYLYLAEARRYDPDRVLLCFFLGNDFVSRRTVSLLHPERLLCLSLITRLFTLEGEAVDTALSDPEAPTFSEEAFLGVEKARLENFRVHPGREVRERFRDTLDLLGELCGAVGGKLRVALIPDELQVNDALFRRIAAGREADFDRQGPNRTLIAFFQERGVPVLDLLGPRRGAQRNGPAYKARDTHWNREGNAVAAEALAKWLIREGP